MKFHVSPRSSLMHDLTITDIRLIHSLQRQHDRDEAAWLERIVNDQGRGVTTASETTPERQRADHDE